jgi:RHS repeat-associated protein
LQASGAALQADMTASRAALQAAGVAAVILARHDEAAQALQARRQGLAAALERWQGQQDAGSERALRTLADRYDGVAAAQTGPAGAAPAGAGPRVREPAEPLRWRGPARAKLRAPADTPVGWMRQLLADQQASLAQAGGAYTTLGGVRFTTPPAAGQEPQDADVGETPDVQLSDAIRARAAQLGGNPVRITDWVARNIRWEPGWGALQGAQATLDSGSGNALDIASLHIALLRAAGIPARYQLGTIDVPVDALMNWLGGVSDARQALGLLAQGGVAARAIEEGGRIVRVRMEHAWVKAYVHWTPWRGARDGGAQLVPRQHPHPNANLNAWVVLDGAYRQHESVEGVRLQELAPFSAQAAQDAARQGASCTAASAQGLNLAGLQAHYARYAAQARQQLGSLGEDLTVGQVLGLRRLSLPGSGAGTGIGAGAAAGGGVLPGSLPYAVVAQASELAQLPTALRWQIGLTLGEAGAASGQGGQVQWSAPLSQVQGQKLSLQFVPETAADAQALAALLRPGTGTGGEASTGLPARIPAYLVRVKARLQLDGRTVGEAGSWRLGQALNLRTQLGLGTAGGAAAGSTAADAAAAVLQGASDRRLLAGETHAWSIRGPAQGQALAVAAQGQLTALQAALQGTAQGGGQGTPAEQASQLLGATAAAWQAGLDARARLSARAAGVLELRLPSVVRASTRLQVQQAFGLDTYVLPAGVGLHGDWLGSAVARLANGMAVSGTADQGGSQASLTDAQAGLNEADYAQQSLQRASVLAHQTLDALYGVAGAGGAGTGSAGTGPAGAAAQSALSGLLGAVRQGQRIWRVDAATLGEALAGLESGHGLRGVVQQAAAAGQRALVATQAVDLGGAAWPLPLDPLVLQEPQGGGSDYGVAARGPGAGAGVGAGAGEPGAALRLAAQRPGLIGWLGLADASATAVLAAPVAQAAQGQLRGAGALLADDVDALRWSAFAGQGDVLASLYQSRLAATPQPAHAQGACEWLIAVLAAQLGPGLDAAASANRAPVITSQPLTQARADVPLRDRVLASDPDGDPLSYSLLAAPTGMTIDAAGQIQWPRPLAGRHDIAVRVSDGKADAQQRYSLQVSAAARLQLQGLLTPQIASVGQTVSLTVSASRIDADGQRIPDAQGGTPLRLEARLDGQPLALDAQGSARFAAPAVGVHRILLTATDPDVQAAAGGASGGSSIGTATQELLLTVNAGTGSTPGAFTATLASPAPDAGVRGLVRILGTADAQRFAAYSLMLRPVGSQDGAWQTLTRSLSPVTGGQLGQLDTSLLANGLYQLQLSVVNLDGVQATAGHTIEALGNLKLGQFRLSFADIRAEAPGFPLTLTRTYDSARKDVAGDFGWGWSAASQDVTLRKNMTLGSAWVVETRPQTNELCIKPEGTRRISITLPDGGLYRFDAKNYQECRQFQVPDVQIVYTAVPGPAGGSAGRVNAAAQLRVVGSPLVLIQGGQIVDADTGTAFNPDTFELTTEEGFKYAIKEGVGILNVTDPYGNTVFYGTGGLQHSAQLNVSFERDGQGRITKATDPNGKSLVYAYNAQGELASVTDREGQVTKFSYATAAGSADTRHLLASITDPRGVVVMSNQFDEYGRLTSVADANGQASQQEFDLANNRQTVTNKRGFKTVYTFDADGNITRLVNALGHTTTFSFDANGNELSTTNALGQTTERSFDATTGRQLTEKNPLGHTTATVYSSGGAAYQRLNPQATVDARGHTTTIAYPAGQSQNPGAVPEQITEPLGRTTEIVQNVNNGNLVQLNIAGEVLNFAYDSKGRRTSETNGAGAQVLYTYDDNGNETSRTVLRTVNGVQTSQVTTRKYDSENRLIEETDPLGARRTMAYNAIGKLASQTDAKGRVTTFTYDGNGRLAKTAYPDGTSEITTYDAEGNETARTDRQGRVTRMSYDALDRLTRTDYPDGSFETTEYDPAGRVVATTDRRGQRATMEYDAAGRQTASVDASGVRTTSRYDENGNRIATSVAGRTTTFTYDALNRLTRTEWPDGSSHTSIYRPDNRKASETDARGVTTSYGYDAAGRLISVAQSLSANATATTAYAYDETGAKTTQVDAKGRTTTWTQDAAGRVTARKIQDGSQETSSYDLEGNRTAKKTFAGEQLSFQYDTENRLTGGVIPQGAGSNSAVPAASVVYRYSPAGNLTSVTEQGATSLNGTQVFSYDANNRLIGTSSPVGQISYTLDAAGNIIEDTASAGTSAGTTKREYDPVGRLSKVIARDGKQTTYSYDSAGRLVRTERELNPKAAQAQWLVTWQAWDAADRLVAVAQVLRTGASETLIAGQKLVRRAGGQIERIETYRNAPGAPQGTASTYNSATAQFSGTPVRTQAFEYDANSRLTREQHTQASATTDTRYAYDAAGNRTQKLVTTAAGAEITTYTYDAADRLVQESVSLLAGGSRVTSYGWDGNGNLASKTEPGKTTLYRFDPQNRLIDVRSGATQADAQAATPAISYAYDAAGNRVRKGGANATGYLIDSTGAYPQVAVETSASGTATAYVRGHQLIRQTRLNGTSQQDIFPMYGHLGTSLGAVDVDGNLIEQTNADAFGVLDQSTGNPQTHLYAGEYWDQDAQLLYLRARWYDPRIGRFISSDPFEGRQRDPRSLNRMAYANGDPVHNADPSGRMSLGEVSAVSDIQGLMSVASRVGSVLNFYSKVNSTIELVMGIRQLLIMFDGDLTASTPRSIPTKVDFSDAAEKFVRGATNALSIGKTDWLAGYVGDYGAGKRLTAYVMYLPVLVPQFPTLVNTGRSISGKPVKVGLGGPGGKIGSLGGIGLVMGKERQLFRMDIGLTPAGHKTGKGFELDTFNDPPFSFHVYKWHGGPR